jgi:hypothetical protein
VRSPELLTTQCRYLGDRKFASRTSGREQTSQQRFTHAPATHNEQGVLNRRQLLEGYADPEPAAPSDL